MEFPTGRYEKAFSRTESGTFELKELPAGHWMVARGDGEYFEESERLFMRLFRFINANQISMTVPVEGHLETPEMRFYLGCFSPGADLPGDEHVQIISVEPRLVVSLGSTGGYNAANIASAIRKLEEWLERQDDLRVAGDPYAVFWHGPYVPPMLKKFEVHIPVRKIQLSGGQSE